MYKILIVEDELIAAEYLKEVLTQNGFAVVDVVDNGKEALQKALVLEPHIVLMDVMLKDSISGAEAAVNISRKNPNIAIVFLSAYSSSAILDYAVESNSYGYLMKPYNENEIVSTLKVVCAKLEKEKKSELKDDTTVQNIVYLSPLLYYDKSLQRVMREEEEVHLGSVSLRFIDLLCQTPNVSVSLEQIYHHVWQEEKSATTLRTLIYRIRQQCGVDFIVSVNGLGYMIKARSSLPKE